MSKFIEKLKKSTQITPAPMGFGRSAAQAKPRLTLVAALSGTDMNNPEYIAGADAVLLEIDNLDTGLKTLQKLSGTSGDIFWGARVKGGSWNGLESPGFNTDFLVFPLGMPLFKMTADLGKAIEIDAAISDSLLRGIEDLPVDAVLVELPGKLNWQSLALLQRIDGLISKLLLVKVQSDIKTDEMETLWKAGADALVIEIISGKINRIKELRETIDKASFPLPRKSKKVDVSLPLINSGTTEKTEEEEGEEEEE
jgi:hypothetical protein